MKDIINFILIFLNSVGLYYLISESSIFKGIRNYIFDKSKFFTELINCEYCLTFHTTYISMILFYFIPLYFFYPVMSIGLLYLINKMVKLTKFKI